MNEHMESHNGVTNEELLEEMKKTKEEVLNALNTINEERLLKYKYRELKNDDKDDMFKRDMDRARSIDNIVSVCSDFSHYAEDNMVVSTACIMKQELDNYDRTKHSLVSRYNWY